MERRATEVGRLTPLGYPRTGTRTLEATLAFAFPELEITPTQHRITPMTRCPNVICIFREPLECISSWMTTDLREEADPPRYWSASERLGFYIRFANKAIESNIFCTTLNQLRAHPNRAMFEYSQKYNLGDPQWMDMTPIEEFVKTNYPLHYPHEHTRSKTRFYEEIEKDKLFKEANDMYQVLVDMVADMVDDDE